MKRWFIILLTVPLVLWSGYWAGTAFLLKSKTEAFLETGLPGQLNAMSSQTQVRGYPTDFQVHMADFTIRNMDMFAWTSPMIEINAPSYSPQNIRTNITGPQQIRSKFGDMVLTSDDLQITLLVEPVLDLSLGLAQLDLVNARLVHDDGWEVGLDRLMIAAQDAPSGALGTYDLDARASAVSLSKLLPELPSTHDEIRDLQASMSLEFTQDWDVGLLESSAPSLRKVTIRDIEITFGASLIKTEGELALNAENRLSGALLVEITGWRKILSVLRNVGYVDPDIADMIVEFMDDQNQPDTLELPLVIQDGQVRFGVFTLGTVPALQ